ncbi:kynureninase [Reyranella soli]|uniref:Kynureninase n=1 Tax=Reyranella soli TaxID=1230389 RepID=A0A512N3A7_9HYPH|nr:kynureninase [Reyranella soli]GEP53466.1 kynureninase [Reyranella soli]
MSAVASKAASLDLADPLSSKRDLFELPAGIIYLDGNSLGPPPKAAFAELEQAARREWGEGLIRSWNEAGWWSLTDTLGDRVGRLIGAQAGETVVTDTTSINVFKALHAALALRPERRVILAERDSFPTDLYIAEGVAASRPGTELRLAADGADLGTMVDERTAVMLINHVSYRTGALRDMADLTRRAHQAGALVVWDLCHSAGVVPIELDTIGVDFAIGCTYKYLNGGPGAPAFIYANRRHHDGLVQPLSGWWAHAAPFAMESGYRPAAGIRRLLCGTQPILSLRALKAALDALEGVDIADIRAKSLALTRFFMELVDPLCREFGARIITPRGDGRGSQVAIAHEQAYPVIQALIARGIIGDFRAPDIMRFGFAPLYLSFREVADAVDALRDVLASGAWRDSKFSAKALVT